jgi:hypothetical protein
MFTNVMTESDDKTRWVLAYILFALAETLSLIAAYRAIGHNALGYLSFTLPFIAIIPIVSSRSTLSFYKKKFDSQIDPDLRLDISFRLWNMAIWSYGILIMALAVTNRK